MPNKERYVLNEMHKLWSKINRYQKILEVELKVAEIQAKYGIIPTSAYKLLKEKASVELPELEKKEEETGHDVVALLWLQEDKVPEAARYLHFGLTSYDVVDTALSGMLRDAAELILKELNKLIEILKEKAIKYKYQPIIGRTHGTFAEPLTLGLKFALWYQECLRHRENIQKAKEQISYGKLSGAVGTYAYSPPIIEEEVCKELNLKPIDIASQVIPRELHAYYLSTLALLAASLERFAQEIRHLQRSEVKELSEPILVSGYTGSSAMPHKKNPVICERICGLSRLIRSYAATALENIPLWHERDISHSSVERIILPQVTSFVHYMINKFSLIMKNLEVNIHSIEKNMSLCRDLYFSGRLLLELIKRGLSRREAYYLVQSWCNQVESSKASTLKEIIVKEGSRFSFKEEELAEIFSLSQFFRHIDYIFKKINLE